MSDAYVTRKVGEAVAAAGGSRTQAQRILTEWALKDEALLLALCRPFLKAIVGSAVERATGGGKVVAGRPQPTGEARMPGGQGQGARQNPGKPLSKDQIDAIIARMGQPGAGQGTAVQVKMARREDPAPYVPPAEGTPKQASSIRKIAKSYIEKKF